MIKGSEIQEVFVSAAESGRAKPSLEYRYKSGTNEWWTRIDATEDGKPVDARDVNCAKSVLRDVVKGEYEGLA